LRRTVARIQGDPSLTPDQKAARLATKLTQALAQVRTQREDADRLRQLRKDDPYAYAEAIEAQEAEQRAQQDLALRVSRFIATALDTDPDDPSFLEAGPRDGETYEVGLQRFAEWVLEQSPLVKARDARTREAVAGEWQAKLDALAKEHTQAVAAVKKEMEEAQKVAVAQARAEARSGAGATPPRAGGPGVGGPDVPQVPPRFPDLATIRSLLSRQA